MISSLSWLRLAIERSLAIWLRLTCEVARKDLSSALGALDCREIKLSYGFLPFGWEISMTGREWAEEGRIDRPSSISSVLILLAAFEPWLLRVSPTSKKLEWILDGFGWFWLVLIRTDLSWWLVVVWLSLMEGGGEHCTSGWSKPILR